MPNGKNRHPGGTAKSHTGYVLVIGAEADHLKGERRDPSFSLREVIPEASVSARKAQNAGVSGIREKYLGADPGFAAGQMSPTRR